jgi:DNA sulfur modification protein DndE
MQPPVDRIKLSQAAKDQLVKLKRITKIPNWNVLCRGRCVVPWLNPPSPPPCPSPPTVMWR